MENKKSFIYYKADRPEMLDYIAPDSRCVLDVGCGEGNFGILLKSKGVSEVWGAEYNSEVAKIAKQNLDKVVIGDFFNSIDKLPDNYFDTITFNDALEHFAYPEQILKKIKCKLKSGGVIAASIPNIRYFRVLKMILYDKDFKYEESGIMDNTHLRFFTRKSIERIFNESGYTIKKIGTRGVTKSFRPKLFNVITFGAFGKDTYNQQFLIQAQKNNQ